MLAMVGFVARRPALSRLLFDRLFKRGRCPRRHSAFLEAAVQTLPPGHALDVAMGDGRNALFLARRGWTVTGFDVSPEALRRARDAARREQLPLDAVRSSAQSFDFGAARWDLLVLSYAWAPLSEPAFVARLERSLKPAGLLVFEHLLHDGPGPGPQAAGAPTPGQIPTLFSAFEILLCEEVVAEPDWRPPIPRSEPWRLARLIARKTALA
jgi:SAM-dependent methyltransferase